MRSAESFDQSVVAATGDKCPLRAETVGHELAGSVAIIIESSHEPRRAFPRDPSHITALRAPAEEIRRFGAQEVIDDGSAVDDGRVLCGVPARLLSGVGPR